MWLSFSCILEFPLFPPSLHNTCSCYYLHSQIDADKDSVFWLVNLHPSSIQVERKIGCISIPSKSVQVFWFKFLGIHDQKTWIQETIFDAQSDMLYNPRDLDAKLVSPGLRNSNNSQFSPQNYMCILRMCHLIKQLMTFHFDKSQRPPMKSHYIVIKKIYES